MLVLTRKKDESIVINDNIEIVVTDVQGGKVRLGVMAPRDVTVHRREIYDAIQNETVAPSLKYASPKTWGEEVPGNLPLAGTLR